MKRYLLVVAIPALYATTAAAQTDEKSPTAAEDKNEEKKEDHGEGGAKHPQIPFANQGGIDDWKAGKDNETVFFKDKLGKWYKAELFGPAMSLRFVQVVAVETGPSGTLDRFSEIRIDGQNYPISSFTELDGPPPADEVAGNGKEKSDGG